VIRSFANSDTEAIWLGERCRKFPSEIEKTARRKLRLIDAATEFNDLKNPPNNKLHPLKRDRPGQHAIWINRQWRICFVWKDGDAHDVEITDYHD
jgi:proteic killer suppression protein